MISILTFKTPLKQKLCGYQSVISLKKLVSLEAVEGLKEVRLLSRFDSKKIRAIEGRYRITSCLIPRKITNPIKSLNDFLFNTGYASIFF